MSFLKRGTAAVEAAAQADAEQEAKKAAAGGVRRFWMPEDGETRITFLDGHLTEDGLLDAPRYNEHQVHRDGHWRNWYVCTEDVDESEPCPVCESGNNKALVAAFTVLDHSQWKDKQNNVHQHEKRLYIIKRDAFKLLSKLAVKRGGLVGCTFDVMRSGDKSPNTGNQFDFIEKTDDVSSLVAKYGLEGQDAITPYDYEEVIKYLTPKELKALGFGSGPSLGASPETQVKPTTAVNYDDDV